MLNLMKSSPAIITICICLLAAILSGCGTGYKTFAFKDNDWRFEVPNSATSLYTPVIFEHPLFTFEYPSSFNSRVTGKGPLVKDPLVTSLRFTRNERGMVSREEIYFEVKKMNRVEYQEDTAGKAVVDNVIARNSASSNHNNLRVIERRIVDIGGIPAEYAAYTYLGSSEAGDMVVMLAAFYSAGFIWQISLECYAENAAETAVYFNHLLETFQFLEPYQPPG
jgi:hypothetical protein